MGYLQTIHWDCYLKKNVIVIFNSLSNAVAVLDKLTKPSSVLWRMHVIIIMLIIMHVMRHQDTLMVFIYM